MKTIKINGRGHLTASWERVPDGVVIRLDDDNAPEFWAELHIPTAILFRMRPGTGEWRCVQCGLRGEKDGLCDHSDRTGHLVQGPE